MKINTYLHLVILLFLFSYPKCYGQKFTLDDIDLSKPISLEGWKKSNSGTRLDEQTGAYVGIEISWDEFTVLQDNKLVTLDRETYDSLFVSAKWIEKGRYLAEFCFDDIMSRVLKNLEKQTKLKELCIDVMTDECAELLNSFDYSALKSLNSLSLISNSYRAELKWPKNIHKIKNLTELKIEGNLREVGVHINEMKQLRYINLANNKLEQLPSKINELKKLILLDISNNQIRSLPIEFDRLRYLEKLDASKNPLKEIPVKSKRQLKINHLDLSNTAVNEDQLFNVISLSPDLVSLCLENSGIKTIPLNLLSKNHLTNLNLSNNPIDFSFSDHILPALEILNLSKTQTDTVSEGIKNYVSLKNLNLKSTDLMYLNPKISELNNLESVNLSYVKIAYPYVQNALRDEQIDDHYMWITNYSSLSKDVDPLKVTSLRLSFKQINELGDHIKEFKNLQIIWIDNQNIHNPEDFVTEFDALSFNTILSGFNYLVEYRYRYFDWQSGRTYVNLEGVHNIKSLKIIDFTGTLIKQIPDDVVKLENLENLVFRNCGLEEIPSSLNKFKKLKSANFSNIINTDGYDHYKKNHIKIIPNSYKTLVDEGILTILYN